MVKLVDGEVLINLNRISMRLVWCVNHLTKVFFMPSCHFYSSPWGNGFTRKKNITSKCCCENYADVWKQSTCFSFHVPFWYAYTPANLLKFSFWKKWLNERMNDTVWNILLCRHVHRFLIRMYIDWCITKNMLELLCRDGIYPNFDIHIRSAQILHLKTLCEDSFHFAEKSLVYWLYAIYTDPFQSKLWKTLKNCSHSFNPTNLFSILWCSS